MALVMRMREAGLMFMDVGESSSVKGCSTLGFFGGEPGVGSVGPAGWGSRFRSIARGLGR